MSDNALAINGRAHMIETLKDSYIPILRELIINGRKLTDQQIVGRAMFAAQQGLDPITEVHTLVDKEGHTMSHTMGINGYRRKCLEQVRANIPGGTVEVEFMEIDKAKLPQGAFVGYECRLRDTASYINWQKRLREVGATLREALGGKVEFQDLITACGPAPISTGIGIVYQDELNPYKDKSFNPLERAKKRAEANARKHRFPTTAPVYDPEGQMLINGNGIIEGAFIENGTPPPPPIPETNAAIMADLGYDVLPDEVQYESAGESDPVEEIPGYAWTSTLVSLETARAATSSDGTLYWDMKTDDLTLHVNSILKTLGKNGLSQQEREEKQFKRDVIRAILQWRAQG